MTDIQNALGSWAGVIKQKKKGQKAKVVHVEKQVIPKFQNKPTPKPVCDKPAIIKPPPKSVWNNWASREDVKKSLEKVADQVPPKINEVNTIQKPKEPTKAELRAKARVKYNKRDELQKAGAFPMIRLDKKYKEQLRPTIDAIKKLGGFPLDYSSDQYIGSKLYINCSGIYISFIYGDEYKSRAILDLANTRMIIPSSYEGNMKIVQIEKPIRRILRSYIEKHKDMIQAKQKKAIEMSMITNWKLKKATQDIIEKEENEKMLQEKLKRKKEKKKQKKELAKNDDEKRGNFQQKKEQKRKENAPKEYKWVMKNEVDQLEIEK